METRELRIKNDFHLREMKQEKEKDKANIHNIYK